MADFVQIYRSIVKEVAVANNVLRHSCPSQFSARTDPNALPCRFSKAATTCSLIPKAEFFENCPTFMASASHIREITLVTNQWVNSYKRLVPGYEAPVYVAWGQRNRSSLVRVPRYRVGKEKATRMELRSPDPAANPYLAFSVMLAAGLRGIDKG